VAKAKRVKQINFTIPNRVGLLSEITTAVTGTQANINAICAYEQEKYAHFMIITDSNAKAKKPLAKLKFKTEEDDVVIVEIQNKVGELQKVADKITNVWVNWNRKVLSMCV
jgi:hypothetical protein